MKPGDLIKVRTKFAVWDAIFITGNYAKRLGDKRPLELSRFMFDFTGLKKTKIRFGWLFSEESRP